MHVQLPRVSLTSTPTGQVTESTPLLLALHYLSKTGWTGFFATDMTFWLLKHLRLAPKPSLRRVKNISFRSLTLGNFAGVLYYAVRIATPAAWGNLSRRFLWLMLVRSAALTIGASHMGELFMTHDCVIGPLGVFTSVFDLFR
jgi:hypothetical protein